MTRDSTAGIDNVAVPPRNTVVAATMNTKVFLALPWMKSVNPITAFCVANLLDRRRMAAGLVYGDAFVSHSRGHCADLFLGSDCEWMLQIDDDMVVPFGNAEWYRVHTGFDFPDKFAGMNALDRLLSHGKTLVGGLYFGRHKYGAPMIAEGSIPAEADFARTAPIDLVRPTRWVATGCLLAHRSVFLDIEKKFPRLARGKDGRGSNFFSASEDAALDAIDRCKKILEAGEMNGDKAMKVYEQIIALEKRPLNLGVGEDVSFCLRAAAAGHVPHVDFGLVLGHIGHCVYGPKNTFRKP